MKLVPESMDGQGLHSALGHADLARPAALLCTPC